MSLLQQKLCCLCDISMHKDLLDWDVCVAWPPHGLLCGKTASTAPLADTEQTRPLGPPPMPLIILLLSALAAAAAVAGPANDPAVRLEPAELSFGSQKFINVALHNNEPSGTASIQHVEPPPQQGCVSAKVTQQEPRHPPKGFSAQALRVVLDTQDGCRDAETSSGAISVTIKLAHANGTSTNWTMQLPYSSTLVRGRVSNVGARDLAFQGQPGGVKQSRLLSLLGHNPPLKPQRHLPIQVRLIVAHFLQLSGQRKKRRRQQRYQSAAADSDSDSVSGSGVSSSDSTHAAVPRHL